MSAVYISGRITGDDLYRSKFALVEAGLEALEYKVLNPTSHPRGLSAAQYMRMDLAMIDAADVVLFLPDWEDSAGAKLERAYAEYIGKNTAELRGVPLAAMIQGILEMIEKLKEAGL